MEKIEDFLRFFLIFEGGMTDIKYTENILYNRQKQGYNGNNEETEVIK